MNIHRFYFSGILVGPYLDFFEYMELITVPTCSRKKSHTRLVAYTKMVMGLIYFGAFVVLGGKYNNSISLTDGCLC